MTQDTMAVVTLASVPRTKELPEAQRQRVGEAVRRWVHEVHDDNQSAAARALKVTASHISSIISGRRGVGLPFLLLFQQELWARGQMVTLDDILGIEHPSPAEDQYEPIRRLLREELVAMEERQAKPTAPVRTERRTHR